MNKSTIPIHLLFKANVNFFHHTGDGSQGVRRKSYGDEPFEVEFESSYL